MALPIRYNVLSLLARPTSTISSVLLVAVVIGAFAYLQAITDSAFSTMAGTGDANTIIVLNQGAESETISGTGNEALAKLAMVPAVVRDDSGPIVSPELVAISSAFTRDGGDVAVNAAVRGVRFEAANQVRHGRVQLLEGRVFQEGTYEVIVGEAAWKLYVGHGVGDVIQLGTRGIRKFEIVGVFSTGGSAADSEVWGYAETLRDVYGRTSYSSARMLVENQQDGRTAVDFIKGPAVELNAKTEQEYFSNLNTNQSATQVLSIAMIIIMGVAAGFAVANTMYASVAGRTREIGMLRSIGFARSSVLAAFVLEGLMIATAGGLLGCALSLVCDGMQRNILPVTFTTVSYTLSITPKIVGTSLVVAIAIGLIGSVMPAWRAARMNVVTSLREA
ncbi:MAG: ABC transporter permease [Planctomycetota bacterium]|jgi:ABC-type lipoprotein release transport system permease subunit